MEAGKLRHRVVIEKNTPSLDAYGQPVPGWPPGGGAVFALRWASVEPLRGRELFTAQQVKPDVTHRVRLRWLKGLTTAMRIRHAGRYLNIDSIINRDERNIELELICHEAV